MPWGMPGSAMELIPSCSEMTSADTLANAYPTFVEIGQSEVRRGRIQVACHKAHHVKKSKCVILLGTLSDDLDNTAGLLDLLLRERRDESGLDDEWRVDSALAQLSIRLCPMLPRCRRSQLTSLNLPRACKSMTGTVPDGASTLASGREMS